MKLFDGITTINVERKQEVFEIELLSTQFKSEVTDILPSTIGIAEAEESLVLAYPLSEEAISFAAHIQRAKTRLDKLRLAGKLAALSPLAGKFNIPFVHPENIFFLGEEVFVVHFGLHQLMAPFELSSAQFLLQYKALIAFIFQPSNAFDAFVLGEQTTTDAFVQKITQIDNLSELKACINHELVQEERKIMQKVISVSKGRYQFFKYFGMFAIMLALVLSWFTFTYHTDNQKQTAIITAKTSFLTNNHAQTQADLKEYALDALPKSARYILAISAVNLSDLTMSQKQTILNTISIKSDDNTLNYWAHTGRGAFDEALDLAKNLGDAQLTLFAYTNLYETTKLNTTMNGEEKQKRLDEYTKEIETLTKGLE
jgi:type VII secretion protein EssB